MARPVGVWRRNLAPFFLSGTRNGDLRLVIFGTVTSRNAGLGGPVHTAAHYESDLETLSIRIPAGNAAPGLARIAHTLSSQDAARGYSREARAGFSEGLYGHILPEDSSGRNEAEAGRSQSQ